MPEVGWPAVFLPTFYGRVGDEKKEPVAPAIPEGSEMRASEMSCCANEMHSLESEMGFCASEVSFGRVR